MYIYVCIYFLESILLRRVNLSKVDVAIYYKNIFNYKCYKYNDYYLEYRLTLFQFYTEKI